MGTAQVQPFLHRRDVLAHQGVRQLEAEGEDRRLPGVERGEVVGVAE